MNVTATTGSWLIGGAGRSGKTTLADALRAHSRTVAGFPLEGVFHVYLQRRFPFFRHQRRRLITEYMDRPRYMDALRTKVERPRDHLVAGSEQLAEAVPDGITNPISLFAWILDRYAEERGKQAWAVFDLLPELRFATYRRLLPGARLVVMQRTPEEAVAEALFWRTYPDAPEDRQRRFQNILFQWCLSRRVAELHRERNPDAVAIFSFNALVRGDEDEIERMANTFDMNPDDVRSAFGFDPPFSHVEGGAFRGPDGNVRTLLTDRELADIRQVAAGHYPRRDLAVLLGLAGVAPVLARGLGDFLMYPGMIIRRRMNALRQRAADASAGIRLFLGAAE